MPSARVVFEWRSLDHVAPGEAYSRIGRPFDCFHINSIEVLPDGDYLISARNTWAVYKVSRDTGKVVWRLNGKQSDFAMGHGLDVRVAARRALARRRPDEPLRQRRQPAGGAAVAGAHARRRREAEAGDARPRVRAPARRARARDGERAAPPEREPAGGLGLGARGSPSTPPDGEVALRRDAAARRRELPRLPLPVARPAGGAAGPRRAPHERGRRAGRELERRDRGRVVAASRRARRRGGSTAGVDEAAERASRRVWSRPARRARTPSRSRSTGTARRSAGPRPSRSELLAPVRPIA